MTRNTDPFLIVVPISRAPLSSLSSTKWTGKSLVVQISCRVIFGRLLATWAPTSSILTTALPLASWPVTTRRILIVIGLPLACNASVTFSVISSPGKDTELQAQAQSGLHQWHGEM